MVTLYYVTDKYLEELGEQPLSGQEIDYFEDVRRSTKGIEDDALRPEQRKAIEFGRYSQGPTSGTYLTARLHILVGLLRGDLTAAEELFEPGD